jgi:hypothetical protein
LQTVQVMAPHRLIGSLARVTVTKVGSNSLFGVLAEQSFKPTLAATGA